MGCDQDRPQPPNYLRAWREHRGLTQAQLAAIVDTEGSVISLLESGDRGLSGKWLRRLAPALETTPGLLLDFPPEGVDEAMLQLWGRMPEAKKSAVKTKLFGNVVELRAPSRDQDEDPVTERDKKR
ncbi:MAG TPA: helix-turn-helix transcriptional regulator [Caulobacteraceae bacterium]|jgi:transcriptional regulator with XRE-family HTH domain|nr:helix-turn-helix transcriptional regulator [Caulobacteraceae bacterium]